MNYQVIKRNLDVFVACLGLSESHLGWKCCLLECVVYFS